jgi:hypothetical protein
MNAIPRTRPRWLRRTLRRLADLAHRILLALWGEPTHEGNALVAHVGLHRVHLVVVRRIGDRLVRKDSDPVFTLRGKGDGRFAGHGWTAHICSGRIVGTLDLFAIPDGAQRGHRLFARHMSVDATG